MTRADTHNLARKAQSISVDVRVASGVAPNTTWSAWQTVHQASAEKVVINMGAKPSEAIIQMLNYRWDADCLIHQGDQVRIRTDHTTPADRGCIFAGFVTKRSMDFAGGEASHESLSFLCKDWRWYMSITSPVYGQWARGESDFTSYGVYGQAPIAAAATGFTGRRCIFNPNRTKNKSTVELTYEGISIPIFIGLGRDSDTDRAFWTARDMVRYLLSPLTNLIFDSFPGVAAETLYDLAHADWDKVLHGVSVEGLDVISAVAHIASQIGWSFYESYAYDGSPHLYFFKVASGSGVAARGTTPVMQHELHVPAVGENLSDTVHDDGPHMICAGRLDEDIEHLINNPWGMGAPWEFEITAELVPAWLDSQLAYDTTTPYYSEADILAGDPATSSSFFDYFHPRGGSFRHNVGRKWALNESGLYTCLAQTPGSSDYDRGRPFNFANVLPERFQNTFEERLAWGPFRRRLLNCLTLDDESLNSIGVKVEFSFDFGANWHVIPNCAIRSLEREAGIHIDEPNLSDIKYTTAELIGGSGQLADQELNYWTSLCHDKGHARSFKAGIGQNPASQLGWQTRVRVTGTIQMDQRLLNWSVASTGNGSRLAHVKLFDLSDRYAVQKRTTSSSFTATNSHVWDRDNDTTAAGGDNKLQAHLDAIRTANEDMSISGMFVLDRLWLGEGTGYPHFMPGDVISKITGRNRELSTSISGNGVRPEIVQIIYDIRTQRQTLLTRDLRFQEATL